MILFAVGGEALIGPIDFTPVYLVGLLFLPVVLTPAIALIARTFGVRWPKAWRFGGVAGAACIGGAAGWCLVWLISNKYYRSQIGVESGSFLVLLAVVMGACGWCIRHLLMTGRRV
jgi:hypothetical protein